MPGCHAPLVVKWRVFDLFNGGEEGRGRAKEGAMRGGHRGVGCSGSVPFGAEEVGNHPGR